MNFFCVYTLNRKTFDKYCKVNKIKKKVVIDVNKIIEDEELELSDKEILKIIIFQKIQKAMDNKKDIYYIPNYDEDFSIEKLMNIRKLLVTYTFNVLIFYEHFKGKHHIVEEALENLDKFDNSQIIKEY